MLNQLVHFVAALIVHVHDLSQDMSKDHFMSGNLIYIVES